MSAGTTPASADPDGVPGSRIKSAAADGFSTNAAAYERSRPSYPAEAVACVVGRAHLGPGRRVLDLAAGTGKLTRLLTPSGADVVAVEPVEAMRAQLRATTPDVQVLDGTAESIPLPDESVDAVVVAQAFHWFDPARSLAEMRRVLRDGATLLLLWNTRDRSVGWVREFGELLVDGDLERPYDMYYDVDYPEVVASAGGFSPLEMFECRWNQVMDPELLVTRAESISVVGALDPAAREVVLERVRNLARTHPELAGRAAFDFPYTTRVFWCHRI